MAGYDTPPRPVAPSLSHGPEPDGDPTDPTRPQVAPFQSVRSQPKSQRPPSAQRTDQDAVLGARILRPLSCFYRHNRHAHGNNPSCAAPGLVVLKKFLTPEMQLWLVLYVHAP